MNTTDDSELPIEIYVETDHLIYVFATQDDLDAYVETGDEVVVLRAYRPEQEHLPDLSATID